jgi:hypothetical protein
MTLITRSKNRSSRAVLTRLAPLKTLSNSLMVFVMLDIVGLGHKQSLFVGKVNALFYLVFYTTVFWIKRIVKITRFLSVAIRATHKQIVPVLNKIRIVSLTLMVLYFKIRITIPLAEIAFIVLVSK